MDELVGWAGVLELVNEDEALVDDGDDDSAEGPDNDDEDDDDNACGGYYHTETMNDDVGVDQVLKARGCVQMIGFESIAHDLKCYHKVKEEADGMESGENMVHAYQSSTTVAAARPMSWVN